MAKKSSYLGIAAAGAAGLGLYFLFGKKAKAATPLVVPAPPVEPAPVKPSNKRPPGSPPPQGAGCADGQYDAAFWNSRASILNAFDSLGYATPQDRDTMNKLGADNALGGGDDVSNPEVVRFQNDYNKVSKRGEFAPKMGGLDPDGLVGPCTLNGMKYVLDNLGSNGDWGQIVKGS